MPITEFHSNTVIVDVTISCRGDACSDSFKTKLGEAGKLTNSRALLVATSEVGEDSCSEAIHRTSDWAGNNLCRVFACSS